MKILILLNNFLAKNRKNIIYILGFLAVFFVLSDFTFAGGGETASSPQDKDKSQVITALNEALKAIAVVLTLGTNFVGWFLYPEWTSGKIIGIDQTLKTLWIMVSNIVYFIFAGIFIWIAFMNIIGKDGETYELKKAIPRFIIGVLIVPFSWFFVQFIISISSIFTAAVLSLPMTNDLYSEGSKKVEETKIKVCNGGYTIKTGTPKALEGDKNAAKSSSGSSSGTNYVIKCESENEESLSKILTGNGIYSIMYFYTFGVMKFDDYGKLFSGDLVKGVTDILDLIFKTGFSIIFIVVYAILVIALGLALFVRVLRLWFFALFSPIFGLLYFFKKDGGGEGVVKNFNVKNFISLALVPVYVSAALAFGMVFILTADTGIQKSGLIKKEGENHCVNLLPDTASKGNQATKVCWDGVYHGENNKATESFKGFVGNFGNFLLQVFGIIFLRMGVMAALKSSDITGEVVDPVAKFGSSIGDLMKKMPTYAPIFPGGLSAQGLSKVGSTVSNIPETRLNQKMAPMLSKIQNTFGAGNTVDPQVKSDVARTLQNGIESKEELDQLRKTYLAQVEKYGLQDKNVQEMRKQILEAMKDSKGTARDELERIYGVDKNLNVDDLRDRKANLALLGKGSNAINDADKLGTALMPGAITGLVSGGQNIQTPGNGTQTININTGDKNIPNTNVSVNLNNGKIADLGEFNKGKGQYTETDFRVNILDKITGIDKTEKDRIITELKKIKDFFKS